MLRCRANDRRIVEVSCRISRELQDVGMFPDGQAQGAGDFLVAPLVSALSNTAFRFFSVSPMYWLITADRSTLKRSTFKVSANISADFLRRSAVDPDRTRTAADVALGFCARRPDVLLFCPPGRVRFPLINLSAISLLRSSQ